MALFVAPVAALLLGFLLGLLRTSLAVGAGVAVFVGLAAYTATGPRGSQDGEPITGVAAVAVVLLWVLAPWLLGASAGALVRRRRAR